MNGLDQHIENTPETCRICDDEYWLQMRENDTAMANCFECNPHGTNELPVGYKHTGTKTAPCGKIYYTCDYDYAADDFNFEVANGR